MTGLQDQFGRPIHDLRISVTDRCNFRCPYCMPKEIFGKDFAFLPKEQLLTFEEIERLANIFVELGVKKIRLTGGEPLLRRNIHYLIEKLAAIPGVEDIGMTTNGVLLEKMATFLKQAGLKRVNISLDALNSEQFRTINNSGVSSAQILQAIDKAVDVGLEVKINMVVKKDMNDEEIIPMAQYFKNKGLTLRFIEFMDVGQSNKWDFSKVITKKQIYEMLSKQFELIPISPSYIGEVAKRYHYKGSNTEVGFISSVSESFCSTCTRARIAADGKMYTCLFATAGFDLKKSIRSGKSNAELKSMIETIWKARTDRYSDERTEETSKNRKKIEMSYIGG